MPIPFILAGAAAVAGLAGLAKGAEAMSNNSRADELMSSAEYMYERAKEKLERQKSLTTEQLNQLGKTKLYSWSEDIGLFLKLFSKFKNLRLESKVEVDSLLASRINNTGSLKNMELAALKADEVLKIGVGSLGAGALAGIASYGGAMMFASASTGTAITALSGVAATNATLAWFGGGSLAAGGFGMAGGAVALGGIVLGPVLAVAGFLMAAKSEENLAKAREVYAEAENASEKMATITSFLDSVEELARAYEEFILEYREHYQIVLNELKIMTERSLDDQGLSFWNRVRRFFGMKVKVDFTLLSTTDQQLLHRTWLLTQVLNAVLATPLLTKEGNLDSAAEQVLGSARNTAQKMLPEIDSEYEIECDA